MMTDMFLIAGVESNVNTIAAPTNKTTTGPATTTAPTNETTTGKTTTTAPTNETTTGPTTTTAPTNETTTAPTTTTASTNETTTAPTNETTTGPTHETTAQDSGGKELRVYVNLRPLLCSESECVCVYGGRDGGGGVLPTF